MVQTQHADSKKPLAKEPVEVYVRTAVCEIEGTAHFFPGARISEFLNRPDSHFLPLTGVRIRDDATGQTRTQPFIALNKEQIVYLAPMSE